MIKRCVSAVVLCTIAGLWCVSRADPVNSEYSNHQISGDSTTVTPEDFGAFGDGRQDDTQAVQQALDAAGGRKVMLGDGKTYLISRTLKLQDETSLVGYGKNSVLHFTWFTINPVAGQLGYLQNADPKSGNRDIVLSNFVIAGAGNGLPSGLNARGPEGLVPFVPGIRILGVDHFRIEGIEVNNVPGISVLYLGCSHGLIEQNWVHNSGRDGITGFWQGRNLTDIVVRNNKIERVGDDGIAIWGDTISIPNRVALPNNITIANNVIRGWIGNPNGSQLGRGIAIGAASNIRVEQNDISYTVGSGILVKPSVNRQSSNPDTGSSWRCSYILVSGNTIDHAGWDFQGSTGLELNIEKHDPHDGITVEGAQEVELINNTIRNPYGRDFVVTDCTNCIGVPQDGEDHNGRQDRWRESQ